MYDIQSALRRRAMAERLEALSRADEATRHATDAAEAAPPPPTRTPRPPASSGPRHLAEPTVTAPTVTAPTVTDPIAIEPAPTPAWPASGMPLGATPLEVPARPRPPMEAPRPTAAPTLPPAAAPALPPPRPGTAVAGVVTAQSLDQTAQLEVLTVRTEPAGPPARRGSDLSVPPGVTLLRDSLELPPQEALALSDGVIDLTVGGPARTAEATAASDSAAPAHAGQAAHAAPAAVGEVRIVMDRDLTDGDLAGEDLTDGDLAGDLDDEPPRGGSSASTIADLLRHGGSGLFFKR